jgi:hypothetical protein
MIFLSVIGTSFLSLPATGRSGHAPMKQRRCCRLVHAGFTSR